MRKILSFLFLSACAVNSFIAMADDRTCFVVGSDVCYPIVVRAGGHSYTVYSSLEINGHSGSVSATDCNGRSLRYDFGSDSGTENGRSYSRWIYTFRNKTNYDANGSSGGYGSSGNAYDTYESAARAGQAVGNLIFGLGGGAEGKAYPSLQLVPGLSRSYGEFVRLRYTGYGVNLYAGIGKDFLFDGEFNDKLLWHAGIGSYFAFGGSDPNMDISLGLTFAQCSEYEKASMMIDADYTCWLGRWRRVGLFAGGGVGWGDFVNWFDVDDVESGSCFAWNLEAGIVIRIANF